MACAPMEDDQETQSNQVASDADEPKTVFQDTTEILVERIIEECIKGGAVAAGPGEFTKRAFQNGKIDLIQAESLLSLINAKSTIGVQISNTNLTGSLTRRFKKMRELLIKTLGLLEYELDISETENQKENKFEHEQKRNTTAQTINII